MHPITFLFFLDFTMDRELVPPLFILAVVREKIVIECVALYGEVGLWEGRLISKFVHLLCNFVLLCFIRKELEIVTVATQVTLRIEFNLKIDLFVTL